MLKNNLYTVEQLETPAAGTLVGYLLLQPEHPIFKGHFPGQPVLPGVCLLEMVKELLETKRGTGIRLLSAGNIKYLKLVDPAVEPRLKLELVIKEEGEELKVSATSYLQDGSPNFKLKGSFAEVHEGEV